jgi:hypothetical protein
MIGEIIMVERVIKRVKRNPKYLRIRRRQQWDFSDYRKPWSKPKIKLVSKVTRSTEWKLVYASGYALDDVVKKYEILVRWVVIPGRGSIIEQASPIAKNQGVDRISWWRTEKVIDDSAIPRELEHVLFAEGELAKLGVNVLQSA